MDDREILLGELMAEAVAALEERRFDAVDPILDRAGADRDRLLDMIELSLSLRGPASPAPEAIAELADSPMFDERPWEQILEPSRHALGLKRPALLEALAERLGIRGAAGRDRLERRYHELETGLIPAAGATPALTAALGDLLGGIGETLSRTRLNPGSEPGPAIAFNRLGAPLAADDAELLDTAEPTTDAERLVDELFGV